MSKVNNIEERLFYHKEYLESYKKYEKYTKMLEEFNRANLKGISYVQNLLNPAKYTEKMAQKYNLNVDEVKRFHEKADEFLAQNPEIDFNDLTTQAGRDTISELISYSFDKDFKTSNLDIVSVIEYYDLCENVDEFKNKNTDEIVKILMKKTIDVNPYKLYEGCQKYQKYKEEKQDLFDAAYGKMPNIVHIVSGVLEIRPNNVKPMLIALGKIEGLNLNDFEKGLIVPEEEISQLQIDLIINDENSPRQAKILKLQDLRNKAVSEVKLKKAIATQYQKHGHNPLDTDFAIRNKISYEPTEADERDIAG